MDGNQRICAAAAATEHSADRRTSHTASSPRGHLARLVRHFRYVCSYDTTFVGLGMLTVFLYIYFQFPIRRVLGYLTPEVERMGLEADSKLLFTAVVKNGQSYTFSRLVSLHGVHFPGKVSLAVCYLTHFNSTAAQNLTYPPPLHCAFFFGIQWCDLATMRKRTLNLRQVVTSALCDSPVCKFRNVGRRTRLMSFRVDGYGTSSMLTRYKRVNVYACNKYAYQSCQQSVV